MKKAIFLDKDGTIIENVPYNVDPRKIRLQSGVGEGLRELQSDGYLLVVISNQAGVARGLFGQDSLKIVEQKINSLLNHFGVIIHDYYFCPHHPEGIMKKFTVDCQCRKPQPGLLQKAARDFNIDLHKSWMIGDILNDVEAGKRAGCKTVLIDNGSETEWKINSLNVPNYVVNDFRKAVDYILFQNQQYSKFL